MGRDRLSLCIFAYQALIWCVTGLIYKEESDVLKIISSFGGKKHRPTLEFNEILLGHRLLKVAPYFKALFRRLTVEPVCPWHTLHLDTLDYHSHAT
jgi:hypothetical protein